jgi:hypothetical protein
MVFSLRLPRFALTNPDMPCILRYKLRKQRENENMVISPKEKLIELRVKYPNLTEASAKIILEYPLLWAWYEMLSAGMEAGIWAVEGARRALPRGFYCGTFDNTIKSDYYSVKSNRKGVKKTWDHWISPQSFAEIMFNGWDFYCDINEFLAAAKMCSYTIRVTPEENRLLRALTFKNENKELRVKCSIVERYDYVGIKLKKVGVRGPVPFPFSPGPMFLEAEKSIIERLS